MYAIRARADERLIEVVANGQMAPEEALRAVSQAFALAEAGGISRGLCDLSALDRGSRGIVVLGAAFASRFQPAQRVAVVCAPRQRSFCRRLARLSHFEDNFGLFTRADDARAWLAGAQRRSQLPETSRRHLSPPSVSQDTRPHSETARAAS